MSVVELARALRAQERSVTELATERLAAAAAREDLGAFCHLDEDMVRIQATALEARLGSGQDPGPLCGVPVALKDNLAFHGEPLACGSRLLAGYTAPYSATVVERLLESGALVFGRTTMDEFAMGSSTETGASGPVRNPWDPSRVAGGSSGGAAAAVAAGLVPVALGSDTGGSVRQPAAFCGVVGVKPTWGRVSRRGLVALASSLDQVGTLSRGVRDGAAALQVIAGMDPADPSSADQPVPDLVAACDAGVRGLRVGVIREAFGQGPVADCQTRSLKQLADAGAELVPVELPQLRHALHCYLVIATAEASSNLSRFDGVTFGTRVPADSLETLVRGVRSGGFGAEVRRRLLLGAFVLSEGQSEAWYQKACRVRARLTQAFAELFEGVDLLALPTAPTVAFPLGSRLDDPLAMYASDRFTVPANLAGLPAASFPAGLVEGLPVGLQLLAPAWEEERLFAAGQVLEDAIGLLRPPA